MRRYAHYYLLIELMLTTTTKTKGTPCSTVEQSSVAACYQQRYFFFTYLSTTSLQKWPPSSHMWTDIHFLFLHSAIMSKIRRSTELVMMASSVSPPIHQSVHNFTWIPPEQKDSTQRLWTFWNRYIQLKFSEYYLRSTKFSNTIYIGPHIKRNGFYAESTPTLNVLKKNIQLSKSVHCCVPIG